MKKPTFLIPYLPQFKLGLFWTLIDSIGSQGLVILFHVLYRNFAGPIRHGILGCLLSLIYLATAVMNIGLDSTLAPFLEIFSESRKRFMVFTRLLLIPQALFLCSLCILAFVGSSYMPAINFFKNLAPYFSKHLLAYSLLTFFFESMRKTLRTFLQLSFYFRFAAFVELLGVGVNILGIILLHYYHQLTLPNSLQVLMYAALAQLIILIAGITVWYHSLKDDEYEAPLKNTELFFRISKTRLFSWVLNCLHQLYSGNFLVPVCAFQFGIESASLMKVITSISYWITLVTKKALGVTSNALLAHLKSRSPETQIQAFHFLTEVFNQVLYGLLIFLVINGKKIALHQVQNIPTVTWSLLYGMVLLTFLESLFVLYEKWYIVEEDAQTYLGFNLVSIGLLYLVIKTLQAPLAILSAIICIRVLTFIGLSLFSFYRWNIWPSFKPSTQTVLVALVISSIGFALL